MAVDQLQDDGVVRELMDNQQRLENERAPWEPLWKDVDRRVNPTGDGGFEPKSPQHRGLDNFDATAIDGLDRFTAVIGGISIPRRSIWHGLEFTDPELNKLPSIKRWCSAATQVLFAMRYASHTGFTTQATEDIRQIGSYGTAALAVQEKPGIGIRYKALHLSEVYIDENDAGLVDTVHRKYVYNARQAAQQFGLENLTPKMQKAYVDRKFDEQFEFLHVCRPNPTLEPDRFDWRRLPIESVTLGIDEKMIVRRRGYWSQPIAVSRHVTSPRDKYGRSPALKVIGTIKTANEMAKTILRAGHKATDPALAFYDDGDISKLATKPGGMNPGLVNERGDLLVAAIPGGGDISLGLEMLNGEREVIKRAFLEEFFRLLSDPSDRMTATQVLEQLQKEGVLISPFADRHESEKLAPVVMRELDIGMRAKQIPPLPPEAIEAGAGIRPVMTNPLSRMARAEAAAGFARWSEMLVQIAPFDEGVMDLVDTDAAARGTADVLGVPPEWVRTPEQVEEIRAARTKAKEEAALIEAAPAAAGAALDLAKANDISGGAVI